MIQIQLRFKALRAQLPKMPHGSSVVTVSSIAGLGGSPGMVGYGASKHAVIGLTQTAAVEYGPKGIRVNTITP
jgi:3alpha(or 20beta)-hydroxysteroid dehydrogenase